jgi:hypothetical protein
MYISLSEKDLNGVESPLTSRNLNQPLKGKPLYSALNGVYAEVLNDLKVILKESAAKDEATSPVKEGEANEEFCKQKRRKRTTQMTRLKI